MRKKKKSIDDLEELCSVHYCRCGHPVTFHNSIERIVTGIKIIDTYCDHCDCKEYRFEKTVNKKKGDMLGFYNNTWLTFYQIRELQSK